MRDRPHPHRPERSFFPHRSVRRDLRSTLRVSRTRRTCHQDSSSIARVWVDWRLDRQVETDLPRPPVLEATGALSPPPCRRSSISRTPSERRLSPKARSRSTCPNSSPPVDLLANDDTRLLVLHPLSASRATWPTSRLRLRSRRCSRRTVPSVLSGAARSRPSLARGVSSRHVSFARRPLRQKDAPGVARVTRKTQRAC